MRLQNKLPIMEFDSVFVMNIFILLGSQTNEPRNNLKMVILVQTRIRQLNTTNQELSHRIMEPSDGD